MTHLFAKNYFRYISTIQAHTNDDVTVDDSTFVTMATLAAQPITMEQVKALIKKKDEMEEEIQSTMDWLQQPGRPGLKGGLVDKVTEFYFYFIFL